MISTKQRASLRAIAQKIEPMLQVGKDGITESVIKQAAEVLHSHEILKVSVLKTSDLSAKDVGNDLAEALNADIVQVIGSKCVIYKPSTKQGVKHLLG